MMKKISLLVLFSFMYVLGKSQAISQRGTSAVTVQDARLFAQYNFRPPVFPDTVSANLQIGLDSCGALIFSRDINAYYYRACSPKRWVAISSGGGSIDTTSLSNRINNKWDLFGNSNAIAGTNFLGTTNNIPLEFRIKNVKSGIIDSTNKNVGLGFNTFKLNTPNGGSVGTFNVAVGHNALSKDTFGFQNVAVGGAAMGTLTTNAQRNVAIGYAAMNQNRTPSYNVAVGWGALPRDYYGSANVAIGADVANFLPPSVGDTMRYNTMIGYASAYTKKAGTNNVFLGDSTGALNQNGSRNVFIGSKAGKNETGSDKLYIANSGTTSPLIKGDFANQTLIVDGKLLVGGSQIPDSTLDVKGGVRFQALLPSNNASDSMLIVKSNGGVGYRSIPSAGSSVSISQGYGIANSPNPITSTGTITTDTSVSGLSGKYLRIVDTTNKFVNNVTKLNDSTITIFKGNTSTNIVLPPSVVYTENPIMSRTSGDSNIIYFNADTANAWRGGGGGSQNLQQVLNNGEIAYDKSIILRDTIVDNLSGTKGVWLYANGGIQSGGTEVSILGVYNNTGLSLEAGDNTTSSVRPKIRFMNDADDTPIFLTCPSNIDGATYNLPPFSPNTTGEDTLATLADVRAGGGGSGTVTSVDLTMPSAFTVTGNPVTNIGTLAVTGAGLVSQYIRGDGSLANFPTASGGGASVSYYLNGSVSQGTIGGVAYKQMNSVPVVGAGTDFTINANGYIAQFITDVANPNKLLIPAGNWNFETYFSASSGGGSPSFYIELYKYDGTTFTLIASNSATPENITGGTSIDLYFTALAVPSTTLLATDRLAVRFFVTHSGRTITMHTENSHLSQIITTFTTGLTALNGLTAQVQNFATGTSGTDFNISSATATHTFNLPDASATARGVVNTTSQTFEGTKTFSSDIYVNNTRVGQGNFTTLGGNINTALGNGTLNFNSTGSGNTAIGYTALRNNTIGTNNTALGQFGLQQNTTGTNNTTIGSGTGLGIITGSRNTFLGANINIGNASDNVVIANGAGNIRFRDDNTNTILPRLAGTGIRMVTAGASGELSTLPQATTSNDGYLTSTDWTTFNNKIGASDTSVFQRKSISANTIMANNTASPANVTAQTFVEKGETAYTNTLTWLGTTQPSGGNQMYSWSQIGKTVTLIITLNYANPSSAITQLTAQLPSDCPTPYSWTGMTAANTTLYVGNYSVITSNTANPQASLRSGDCFLKRNAANDGYEIATPTLAATTSRLWTFRVIYKAQ